MFFFTVKETDCNSPFLIPNIEILLFSVVIAFFRIAIILRKVSQNSVFRICLVHLLVRYVQPLEILK